MSFSASPRLARFAASLLIALVALEVLLPTGCIGIQAIVGKLHIELINNLKATPNAPGVGEKSLISTAAAR